MVTMVYGWPADLPIRSAQWADHPGFAAVTGVISGSRYVGGGNPRTTLSITGRIVNKAMHASLSVTVARINGGQNLLLMADPDRALYTFPDYYQEGPPGTLQGTILWQDDSGSDQTWTDDAMQPHAWLAGLTRTAGGVPGENTINLSGAIPGMVVERGHKLWIEGRRYVIENTTTASGVGTFAALEVAPYFQQQITGTDRIIYPGDVGLFQLAQYSPPELDPGHNGDWSMGFIEVFEDEYPGGLTYDV